MTDVIKIIVSGPQGCGKTYAVAQMVSALNAAGFDCYVQEDAWQWTTEGGVTIKSQSKHQPPGTCFKRVEIMTTNKPGYLVASK